MAEFEGILGRLLSLYRAQSDTLLRVVKIMYNRPVLTSKK